MRPLATSTVALVSMAVSWNSRGQHNVMGLQRGLVNKGTMGVNSLPKTVTRQRGGCDWNPGPSAPDSSTPELSMGWVDPWVGLGWVEIFQFLVGWVGLGPLQRKY